LRKRDMSIDATARIASGASLGKDVTVGPYCVIGPNVVIGDGCHLKAHVNIEGHTTIGPRTKIASFASLGGPPQSTRYRGGPTRLIVGADCDIRENVTMNTGTEDDRAVTEVGDRCFLMVGSHVAHDCKVGNDVIFANNAVLGGHVTVGDHVMFGGQAAVRQFVRVGEGAMIVGLSGVRADIIPYGMAHGPLADLIGLNVVGLRRRGVGKPELLRLRQAFQAMFFGEGTFAERVEEVSAAYANNALVNNIVAFIRSAKRPLTMAVRRAGLDEL
jgi:UDP-N-acetylglucosamine acyltransferase